MKRIIISIVVTAACTTVAAPVASAAGTTPCTPAVAQADLGQPFFQCYEVGVWKNNGITPKPKHQKRLRPIIREQVTRWLSGALFPGAHDVWSPVPAGWDTDVMGKIKIPRPCMFMADAELNCASTYVLQHSNAKCYRWHQTVTVWKFTGIDGRALAYTGGGAPNARPTGKLARAVKCPAAAARVARAAHVSPHTFKQFKRAARKEARAHGWRPWWIEMQPSGKHRAIALVNDQRGTQCQMLGVWSHPLRNTIKWSKVEISDSPVHCTERYPFASASHITTSYQVRATRYVIRECHRNNWIVVTPLDDMQYDSVGHTFQGKCTRTKHGKRAQQCAVRGLMSHGKTPIPDASPLPARECRKL
jgi:hypothetical protein